MGCVLGFRANHRRRISMKMLNPFPIVELRSLAWEKGFFAGFCSALDRSSDIQPPDLDTADDIDAFNVGVIAGQQATILGWDILDPPCIEAGEATLLSEEDEWMEHTFTGVKLATELTVAVIKRSVVEGVVGVFGAFFEIALSAKNIRPVMETQLPRIGKQVTDLLNANGVPSIEIFCGAASAVGKKGCELLMTALFRTSGQARAAAIATGRSGWAVFSWRTQMSGGFRIVDSQGSAAPT
jgi:hypothetical protein